MKVTPVKTHKITIVDKDILAILDKYVAELPEKSILAISSKIIAICGGRVAKTGEIDKKELIKQEADYYLSEMEMAFIFCGLPIHKKLLI